MTLNRKPYGMNVVFSIKYKYIHSCSINLDSAAVGLTQGLHIDKRVKRMIEGNHFPRQPMASHLHFLH